MKHRFIGIITLVLILSVLLILPLAAQAYDDGTTCANNGKHEFVAYNSQDATCEREGFIDWECRICKKSVHQVTGPALGHNFQFVVRDQPTCTTPGYGIDTCTRCGANRDNGRRIDPLGHNYQRSVAQEATCTKDGMAVYTCSRCGDSYREPIPATGHKWGSWVDGDPATCVQYGNRYHECTRCGQKEWERNYAGGLGDHDWGDWVTVKEPTATEPGLQERTCKVDASHKEQEVIPATGVDEKPALSITLWSKDGDSYSPKTEFAVGESFSFSASVTNIGNVDIELYDSDEKLSYGWSYSGSYSGTRYLLKPGETVGISDNVLFIGLLGIVNLEDVTPGTETETLAGTITYTVTVPGYRPGTDEVICNETASCTIGVLKPADEKPALSITLWSEDGHSHSPKTEFAVGESFESSGSVTNIGNVDIELYDSDEKLSSGWSYSGSTPGTRYLLKPGETVHSWDGSWFIGVCKVVNLKDVTPGTETETLAGTITYTVTVPGYRPGTDEVICSDTASCTIGVLKPADEKTTVYDISASYSKGPIVVEPSSSPERYWTAVDVLSENGGIDWRYHYGYADSSDVTVDRIVWREFRDGGSSGAFCFDPTIIKPQDHIAPGTETEEYAGEATLLVWAVGYLPDTDIEVTRSDAVQIPLLVKKEEPRPALTLKWLYDEPAKEIYGKNDVIYLYTTVINTGNVPLKLRSGWSYYNWSGSLHTRNLKWYLCTLEPGEAHSYGTVISGFGDMIIPGTETEDLLGNVLWNEWVIGCDPDTDEELCKSNEITRTWKIRKPGGPEPWPIPEESDMEVKIETWAGPSDPAGYQLGEYWSAHILPKNTGIVDIPAYTTHIDFIADDEYTHGTSSDVSWMEAEVTESTPPGKGTFLLSCGGITEKDAERGYIEVTAYVKWTDPESGNERKAYSNVWHMPVISKTGLLLNKGYKDPANGEYFEEGEQIEWTLSMKNNSKEPIKDITVTDNGATIGMFAEVTPEQGEIKLGVPKYTVTEYDAKVIGKVTNIANATGTDLKGVEHTYPSNPAVAKAGNKAPDPNDGDGGGGTDPLGPIYGYDIAVSIIKAEAHGPAQEDWYALDENVDYTVTVKNTGKDPIENVTVYDSLNGFAPIGTVGSLAPGEEKTFSFTWKVTQYNVDVMHYVVNQATVTYTFGGGINGTPMKSNKVYVKAGENGFIPEDGLIDPDGDPDGHFDPGLLHGEGDDCCAMTLLHTRDNEAYYQLTLCGEHAKVIADAKAAADIGDWKAAAEIIRTALDEIYMKYYEAGDDSAKAAVMNERLTYYAHIGAYQTLAGDRAAAEKMALKLIQLCSMANTAPEILPDSLANGMNGILGDNPDVTATGRVIGLFDGKNEVTDTYAGADARALKNVKDLLKAAKSYNFDEVFERGQIIWQTALDESVNAIYKAADRETRKQIAAWRISLDNLYTGERPMLEMLYPDNDAAVEEILMNLYRDMTLDKEQVR